MIKLKYIFTSALLVAAASASQAVSRQQMQKQIDKDAPAYTIQARIPSARYSSIRQHPTRGCIWLISPTMSVGWM